VPSGDHGAVDLSEILTDSRMERVKSTKIKELRVWHEGCTQDPDVFLDRETIAELLL
jgi:hypothetical protein